MPDEPAVIITCEHGGNKVPAQWRHLFRGAEEVLTTHRGHDVGALELARRFSKELQAPLVFSTTSRLLVELNRSLGHPRLFSEFTKSLTPEEKSSLLTCYYHPYRDEVRRVIDEGLAARKWVVHLSVHSFTPVFEGVTRSVDVGLLYDPSRHREVSLCLAWQKALADADPSLQVRRNAPYRGTSDGLTTELRHVYAPDTYSGIELEVNQRYPISEPGDWSPLKRLIIKTFLDALSSV